MGVIAFRGGLSIGLLLLSVWASVPRVDFWGFSVGQVWPGVDITCAEFACCALPSASLPQPLQDSPADCVWGGASQLDELECESRLSAKFRTCNLGLPSAVTKLLIRFSFTASSRTSVNRSVRAVHVIRRPTDAMLASWRAAIQACVYGGRAWTAASTRASTPRRRNLPLAAFCCVAAGLGLRGRALLDACLAASPPRRPLPRPGRRRAHLAGGAVSA